MPEGKKKPAPAKKKPDAKPKPPAQAAPAETPPSFLKPRPVIQRRDEKEDMFLAQASFNIDVLGAKGGIIFELRPSVSLFQFIRAEPAGTTQELRTHAPLFRFEVEDRSGLFADQSQYDDIEIERRKRHILKDIGITDEKDRLFTNSFRAARAIEDGINSALLPLNEANVSNATRQELAKKIIGRFAEALIGKHGDRSFLRARSYKGFIARIDEEAAAALSLVRAADYGGVKVSVHLQNSMIDAAELKSTGKKKTAAYKAAIRKIRGTSDALLNKPDEFIEQLALFEEEISYKVANSLLHQARGTAVSLVLKIMEIRQQAQAFARAHGVDPASQKPVDLFRMGFEIACYFPAGLNQKRFTIVANDVLKALGRPFQGVEGTRERLRAEADLFHFAALEYVQKPTKENRDHVLVHSFSMKASTKGKGKGRVRYWAFDNFSDEFLLPARHQFNQITTAFIPYVYENFTGRHNSREKAGEIIKFMTAAHALLMKEERRRAAAGELITGEIKVSVRFDRNYWPKFESKAENDRAKRIMKNAFALGGMTATYEGRGYTMELKAPFTLENFPQQIGSPPPELPPELPPGGESSK